MDAHQLKVFVAVYRSLSFSGAAGSLHISQPTVSEHVKNLERELECVLFDRLGRSIRPTEEARALFPRAVALVEGMESLREEVARTGKDVKGRLTIGASTIPGAYLMPAALAEFRRKHPSVSYEIIVADSRNVARMVSDHTVLVGVVGAQIDTQSLDCVPLFEDEIILVAAPSDSCPRKVGKSGLGRLPFIVREEGSGTRKTVEDSLRKAGADPARLPVTATLGSTEAVKQSVKGGLGVSFISRRAVEDELARGMLQAIPVEGLRITRRFTLVRHGRVTLPGPYRIFCDYLRDRAGKGSRRA